MLATIGCLFVGLGLGLSCADGTTLTRVDAMISAFSLTGVIVDENVAVYSPVLGVASMAALMLPAAEGCISLAGLVTCSCLLVWIWRRCSIRFESSSIDRSSKETLVLDLPVGFNQQQSKVTCNKITRPLLVLVATGGQTRAGLGLSLYC